jgi:hypothetical protein
MAKKSGGDVIVLTKDDFKGRKFKTAPGGKYRARFDKKSKIKPGKSGNIMNLMNTITATDKGKKSDSKGVNVFDNIAPHVGWKIAQILRAIGMKKPPKKMTLKELLALLMKHGKEIRIVVGKKMYNGQPQNYVIQYLPLEAGKDEEDDDIEDADDEDEEDSDSDDGDSDDEDEDDDSEDSDDDDEDDEDEDDEDSDDDDDEEDSDDEDEDEDDDEDEDEDDEEEDDDEDDDSDDDDDEEDSPRRGRKGKAKGKDKKSKSKPKAKTKKGSKKRK